MKIAASLFLIMAIFWTLLPCGFGVHNFAKSPNQFLVLIARFSWIALLAAHFLLMYLIWFDTISYWWLLLLVTAHILFLILFGRDVGTN
jgi:hypothetical protein